MRFNHDQSRQAGPVLVGFETLTTRETNESLWEGLVTKHFEKASMLDQHCP